MLGWNENWKWAKGPKSRDATHVGLALRRLVNLLLRVEVPRAAAAHPAIGIHVEVRG